MEYRQLGRSGLRISTLTLGTMTFGGVNLIDTADVYSDGLAEEILGEALARDPA